MDGVFDQLHKRWPLVAALVSELECRKPAMTPLMHSTLPVVLWRCGEPNTREEPRALWSLVQKALAKRVSGPKPASQAGQRC